MDGLDALRYVLENEIPGCLVECGIGSGQFPVMWAEELVRRGVNDRVLYLIDTFRGMTEPGPNDRTTEDACLFKMTSTEVQEYFDERQQDGYNTWCYVGLPQIHQRMVSTRYDLSKIHYIVGDVRKTLQDEQNRPPAPIAILRLDTDFYDSSKIELETLYDRVVGGGIIIFDDYHHWDGQRRATDEFFKERGLTPKIVNLGNKQAAAMIK